MGTLEGKVAFITGVARGQGRAHAVKLASEGADIIGVDICADIETVASPLASEADLAETAGLVEALGRRFVGTVADVRDAAAVAAAVDAGVAALGRLDIVVANAGILPIIGPRSDDDQAWIDGTAVMFHGVYNTVRPSIRHLQAHGEGGSIVIISSSAGLRALGRASAGTLAYVASKHGIVGLMREWAIALGPDNIRVNTVHPTGVATPMVVNDDFANYFVEHGAFATMTNLLPVPTIDAEDVAESVAFLVSDAGRYITGQTFTVDAGVNAG